MSKIIEMINNINNIGDYKLYDLPNNRQLYVNKGVVKIIEYDKDSPSYRFGLQDNIINTHSAQDAMYTQMLYDDMWQDVQVTNITPFKWDTEQSINMDIRGFFILGYRINDYGYIILDYDGMYTITPILTQEDYEAIIPHKKDFVGIVVNVPEGLETMIRAKIEIYRSKQK